MKWPNDSQRISIVGMTGTGKTQAAAWHLSRRSFDAMPWIVYDFKYDELLNEIEGTQEIDLASVPKKPGLYIVHPHPSQKAEVEAQLWKIHEQENTGIYIDEGYMIGDTPAFRALLTQGRSKHIPIIVLSQRPVWLSRFVFSESDFYQVFWLNNYKDRRTVNDFIPYNFENRLPAYNSLWYSVKEDKVSRMLPVPDREKILANFRTRLKPKRSFI